MTRAVRPRWARHRGGPRARASRRVGEPPALRGVVVVRGGLGGVMGAVCQGTRARGGVTVGLLPGRDRAAGNRFLTVCPPTTGWRTARRARRRRRRRGHPPRAGAGAPSARWRSRCAPIGPWWSSPAGTSRRTPGTGPPCGRRAEEAVLAVAGSLADGPGARTRGVELTCPGTELPRSGPLWGEACFGSVTEWLYHCLRSAAPVGHPGRARSVPRLRRPVRPTVRPSHPVPCPSACPRGGTPHEDRRPPPVPSPCRAAPARWPTTEQDSECPFLVEGC
ncbi:hypothetical protein ACIP98_34870 [Streptomyces sp. NPDC088354]|uniref:SLOG cluster 4 domain-containing protein n=1 Tax=Streptomyces sp. NPDC088354 TaxID=3365856 RepID=UPI0037F3968A